MDGLTQPEILPQEVTHPKRSIFKVRKLNVFQKREKGKRTTREVNSDESSEELEFSSGFRMAPAAKADGGKKLETNAFQIECETEMHWKKLMKRDGLILVDVYSSWAGPCISMINTLKKIKVEVNDDRLWLAIAQTDDISDLHMFHDQSEPTWLFIGGGKPVRVFRGTHVPQLTALIKSEFEHELQCLGGKAKRNVISIDDEVSRRRKAEAEAESLMKFMKDEDQTAEEVNAIRRDSSVRLMHTLEPYTVLVVQNYLLATGALTEIRDELYGEFKIEQERTVFLNEKGVRELFRIPYEIPDPNQPTEALMNFTAPPPPPASASAPPTEAGSTTDIQPLAEDDAPKTGPPKIKTIPVPVPPEIMGDTHIMLIEAIDLKKMMKAGKRPATNSPLQIADDYLQVKVGPIVYADAVEHAPYSLHAIYGKGEYVPGVWCPRRYDDKRYVMINFFPRFVTEMLSPPPNSGTPDYMVAVFPAAKAAEVSLNMELHRQDVLATGSMKLPSEIVDEMVGSWGLPKDSEAYKTRKEKINGDVFVISVNKTNSSLGLAIKALEPVHTSYDNTTGKIESGKLFTQLGINLAEIPNADDVVSKFLARSKKRPASITELALVALSRAPSAAPSGTELAVAPSEGDTEAEMSENEGGETETDEKKEMSSAPPTDEEGPAEDEAQPTDFEPEADHEAAAEAEGGEEEE